MKFFSRETCERLQAAGCVATSSFYYLKKEYYDHDGNCVGPRIKPQYRIGSVEFHIAIGDIPAFGWWDLCGGSERAIGNSWNIWGHHLICRECGKLPDCHEEDCPKPKLLITSWVYYRHAIIDLPEDKVEGYLISSMEGK